MSLIIFDMDGTLIDSGNVITNTINHVRNHFGLESMSRETLLTNLNNPDINSAEFFYGTPEFTKEQTAVFTEYYDEHCITDIVLYDGIEELITNLKDKYSLSVATNANEQFAHKMLDFLGIKEHFSFIAGADMVAKPKPEPDMLHLCCQSLGINQQNAILVGDSNKDKRAAQAANMDHILVNWGFSDYDLSGDVVTKICQLHEKIENKFN
jgi:phosphoglycolate phosphatase